MHYTCPARDPSETADQYIQQMKEQSFTDVEVLSRVDKMKRRQNKTPTAAQKDLGVTFLKLHQELGITFDDDPLQEVLRSLHSNDAQTNDEDAQPDEFLSQPLILYKCGFRS